MISCERSKTDPNDTDITLTAFRGEKPGPSVYLTNQRENCGKFYYAETTTILHRELGDFLDSQGLLDYRRYPFIDYTKK